MFLKRSKNIFKNNRYKIKKIREMRNLNISHMRTKWYNKYYYVEKIAVFRV